MLRYSILTLLLVAVPSLIMPVVAVAAPTPQQERLVQRITNLYTTPPLSFEKINVLARAATVNILCLTSGGQMAPISGSGIIIDPRGIILTNAHVAQYLLFNYHPRTSQSVRCVIRTGTPARATYTAELLYLPETWVSEHAHEIRDSHPTGTGQDDWALLRITGTLNQSTLPHSFPSLSLDSRELATFTDDHVLLASYPAGFLKSSAITSDLYAVSTIVPVGQLYTFKNGSVDAISLGGNILAQAGSSGGAVVNQWGKLVGMITTSSEAATTASRDLRAITLFHINESMQHHASSTLSKFLSKSIDDSASEFRTTYGPSLATKLYNALIQ